MAEREKFLVTGAGGFIGGWVVETLLLSGQAEVRASIHSWSGAARLGRFPQVEIAVCDIVDAHQAAEMMDGVTCVVHCAKGTSETNVQGTANLLEAAKQKGVRHFVHLSTAEVYGSQAGEIDESLPCLKTGNPYGDTKIEAESVCQEYQTKGIPVTIIRPSIVYGPFSKTWTVNIAQKLQSGNWGLFKQRGEGFCNLVYISDLVNFILLTAHDERAAGNTFNITGPDTLTWNQYFQQFNAALGLPELKTIEPAQAGLQTAWTEPVRTVAMFARDHFESPIRQVAAKSQLAKRAMKFLEKKLKTSARATDFSLFNRKAIYSAAKAHNLLGFTPQYNLEDGLQLSVPWLKQIGLLN
jgi:nucleoside-diphosphate-sugar epimerase